MTERQPNLWEVGTPDMRPVKFLSRRDDPATSHQAATELVEGGEHGRMMNIARDVLRANPGNTANELEQMAGQQNGAVRKRLNDLRHKGKAEKSGERKCRITGKTAELWWPVGEGR